MDVSNHKRSKSMNLFVKKLKKQYILVLMCIPALAAVIIFNYAPMYGVQIAFRDYKTALGIWGSPWVGIKHFIAFFGNPFAVRTVKNTFILGIYSFLWGFPAPIILALLINEIYRNKFKRLVQTITYLPYFISTVVIVGMLRNFTTIDGGLFNQIITFFGGEPINFFGRPEWFRTMYIASGIWKSVGWGTIIFLAALSGVNMELYDAAAIDGANRWHRMWNIAVPAIMPTISILMILNIGGILGSDFEKILLMYSEANYSTADTIATYVYREGINGGWGNGGMPRYSYTAAVGLMFSVVSFCFVYVANRISRRISDISLW
jgi:putative aldouronate transport system permease protein